jgi:hypothetical protein
MYANGDATERFATVTVNGNTHILGFASTRGDNIVLASTLHTTLKSGSTNTIEFGSYNGGWGGLIPSFFWVFQCLKINLTLLKRPISIG